MSKATRLGDRNTGHDMCSPRELVESSTNVFINGRGAGRVNDRYASHSCIIHPSHQDYISSGSGSVFINSRPAGRVGDPVWMDGSVSEGSNNVYIGG